MNMNANGATGTGGWGAFDYIVVGGVSFVLILGIVAIFRAIRVVTKDP
ncbi:MAG: hypothetical protein ACYC9S_05990 [Leptospirales bacterium]